MTTVNRVLRGFAALVALAAIVVGIPAAMLTVLDGDPRRLLPVEAWPPLTELPEWVWHRVRWAWDTGEIAVYVLIVAGWVAWLGLTWMITVEVFAQIRHGAIAARGRLSTIPPRRWIAGLVSSVILLGSTTPAAVTPTPAEDAVATAPRHPPSPDLGTFGGGATVGAASEAIVGGVRVAEPTSYTARCPRVRVILGDTLWGLAERHLGDGRRYTEIAGLNRDRLTPAGPNYLEIGWELLLPPDATGLPDTTPSRPRAGERAVTVHDGDTLTAIAARELGDPEQWRTIYQANLRRPQPDGRALVDPDVILPGWTLRLPKQPPGVVDGGHREHTEDTAPPTTSDDVDSPSDETDHGSQQHEQEPDERATPQTNEPTSDPVVEPEPHPGTAISLPTGAYVGLSLAALITIAATTVWLWRRRIYVPGSRRRDDLHAPPIVRAMRLAHDMSTLPRDSDGDLVYQPMPGDRPGELGVQDRALATALTIQPNDGHSVVGITDGRPVAVDLARTRGLALTGPGAPAAARALTVDLLADAQNPERRSPVLLMPRTDAISLLDMTGLRYPPQRLHTTSSLEAALDWLEAELLTRTRSATSTDRQPHDPLVLVASTAADDERRLRAILHSGAEVGIAAILLGGWDSGVTVEVTADGTVESARGDPRAELTGARLFTLPTDDARELLDILGTADAAHDPAATAAEIASERAEIAARSEPDALPADDGPLIEPPTPSPTVNIPQSTPSRVETPASLKRDTDDADRPPLRLSLLGRMHLHYRGPSGVIDIIEAFGAKQRAVLTYLALHRDGERRDAVIAAIWPDAPAERPANRLHAQLHLIRKALEKYTDGVVRGMVRNEDSYYGLDPSIIAVDLWELQDVLHEHMDDGLTIEGATATIADLYRGPLAPDLPDPWLEAHREHLRREVVATLYDQVRAHEGEPERQLAALHEVRRLDSRNEDVYRDIARTQARLERHDAIGDTLARLTASLAEVDERPSPEIVEYCRSLLARRQV